NIISIQYQIRIKENGEWSILNLNSLLIELEQAGIKISMKKLEIIFRSHLIQRYDPIEGYFVNLPEWDGCDNIGQLCSFIKTDDDEFFREQFEKWFTRAVLCMLNSGYVNKQCIVFVSNVQNIGKTTFFRFLVPVALKDFYVEDLGTDKDSLIKLSKNVFINLDELAIKGKADINAIKSFMSKSHINERLPYGRRQERQERRANFTGSTNNVNYLTDETGNVRWLNFEISSINFDYSEVVDIDKIWAQAYYNAFQRKNYIPEMTKEEIMKSEKRNALFQHWTMERELIAKYFEYGKNEKDFMTATDVLIELRAIGAGMNLKTMQIGRALKALKFPVARHIGPKRSHGYLVRLILNRNTNQ
ncbi:MAG: virulence-associated E family protein, partial [Tetragenococcus halophilus]|nr:virulence-associated E family protein [Tetragenococcus halophilus]